MAASNWRLLLSRRQAWTASLSRRLRSGRIAWTASTWRFLRSLRQQGFVPSSSRRSRTITGTVSHRRLLHSCRQTWAASLSPLRRSRRRASTASTSSYLRSMRRDGFVSSWRRRSMTKIGTDSHRPLLHSARKAWTASLSSRSLSGTRIGMLAISRLRRSWRFAGGAPTSGLRFSKGKAMSASVSSLRRSASARDGDSSFPQPPTRLPFRSSWSLPALGSGKRRPPRSWNSGTALQDGRRLEYRSYGPSRSQDHAWPLWRGGGQAGSARLDGNADARVERPVSVARRLDHVPLPAQDGESPFGGRPGHQRAHRRMTRLDSGSAAVGSGIRRRMPLWFPRSRCLGRVP